MLDASGGGAVTGYFSETAELGRGPTRSAGGTDVFVTRFGPSDETLWTRALGGSSDDLGFDVDLLAARSFGGRGSEYGYAIAVSPRGGVVLSGQFNEQLRACGRTLTSAGGSDAFRARVTLPLAGQH